MDMIKILQRMNIIYEIHETYIDIIKFKAHKNNFSELEHMHTRVNKITIRTCPFCWYQPVEWQI